MAFLVELWDSVFQPGTNPALIKATHGSFILLILSLIGLIYLTRSIHFINLLVIACLLYATVVWFIGEIQKVKLETNEELSKQEQEATEKSTADDAASASASAKAAQGVQASGAKVSATSPVKKSKKV